MSDFHFDPNQYEGSSFEPIPNGDYVAEIIDAEIRQPRSLDGYMLALTWKILEGDYDGRQLWQQLCYIHSNEQTQDIARKQLKDICVALGITEQVTDPEVFKFRPARIRVFIKKDPTGQWDDQNRIRRVLPLNDNDGEALEAKAPKSEAPKGKPSPPAANSTGSGPGAAPWKRGAA